MAMAVAMAGIYGQRSCSWQSRCIISNSKSKYNKAFTFHKYSAFTLHFAKRNPSAILSSSVDVQTVSTDKSPLPRWSHKSIKAFCMAQLEAYRMKYITTGTEALLLGILMEGTSFASRFLRSIGINVLKVRAEVVQLRGRPYKYIEVPESPPLTESAQRALDWAINETSMLGEGVEVTNIHMLLGLWAQKGTAGQEILAKMGFDDERAEELAKFIKDEVTLSPF